MFISSPSYRRLVKQTRRAFPLCLSICILLASTPLPMGWKLKPSDADRPFPCQDRPCGCSSPEQCWTSCCCFSPAQRQAWAAEREIVPPEYAVLENTAAPSPVSPHTAAASCCSQQVTSKPVARSCCGASAPPVPPASESHSSRETAALASCPVATGGCSLCCQDESPSNAQWSVVLTLTSVKCHGGSSEYTFLPWGILASVSPRMWLAAPWCGSLITGNAWPPSRSWAPDPPPPRA